MDNQHHNADVLEFFKRYDGKQREYLEQMQGILLKLMPKASQTLSYAMPAFVYHHQVVVYYAPAKQHFGFYPTSEPIEYFAQVLKQFQTTKGTIKFSYAEPLPEQLIAEIVQHRLAQIDKK